MRGPHPASLARSTARCLRAFSSRLTLGDEGRGAGEKGTLARGLCVAGGSRARRRGVSPPSCSWSNGVGRTSSSVPALAAPRARGGLTLNRTGPMPAPGAPPLRSRAGDLDRLRLRSRDDGERLTARSRTRREPPGVEKAESTPRPPPRAARSRALIRFLDRRDLRRACSRGAREASGSRDA